MATNIIELEAMNSLQSLKDVGFYRNTGTTLKLKSKVFDVKGLAKYLKREHEMGMERAREVATFLIQNGHHFPEKDESNKFDANSLGEWVQMYLEDKQIQFRYDGTVRKGNRIVDMEWFFAEIVIAAEQTGFSGKSDLIDKHLTILQKEAEKTIRDALVKEIAFTEVLVEKGAAELDKFILALKGGNRHRHELDKKVMGHFMWLVKRKLIGAPVFEHIMPVLVGPTGAGKSHNLQKLLAPLETVLYNAPSMNMLNDDREAFIMHRYFIVNFDELAGADKTDVNKLKQYITASDVSYRILGQNRLNKGSQNSTFIATSNTIIKRVIYDPTSARRYWQVDCGKRVDVEPFWDELNKIDYLAIWRSIDEESRRFPIKADLHEIRFIQETEFRAETLLEQFLIEAGIRPHPETDFERNYISIGDLYDQFKEFCDDLRRTCPTKRGMADSLTSLEYLKIRRTDSRGFIIHSNNSELWGIGPVE